MQRGLMMQQLSLTIGCRELKNIIIILEVAVWKFTVDLAIHSEHTERIRTSS